MAQNGGRLYGLFDELRMYLSSFNMLSKNIKVGDSRELLTFSLCIMGSQKGDWYVNC